MALDTIALRTRAREIFDHAVAAADPALALRKELAARPLPVPSDGGRCILIAIGKAAPAMLTEALHHVRGPRVALAVTHHENTANLDGATVLRAGHPVPDAAGLAAGQRVMDLLRTAHENDRVIALISGGGSALLPAPLAGISLEDKAALNRLLLGAGLDITQMNLVRQQVSQLKGGGLLRLAAPAPVTAYILSDVIGDDLRAVASGPTVAPIGTREDARTIAIQAGIWARLPGAIRARLEDGVAPVPAPPLPKNILIGSNRMSLEAALKDASRSFDAHIVSDALVGDVASAAERIMHSPVTDGPCALLFGGETTVRLTGTGRGGRNQELALRIALRAQEMPKRPWLFLSGGTDGRDGPTSAAGGFADAGTTARIRAAGLDPHALLANNDSYKALSAAGDLLETGATGTNVADIQMLLLA
ncbi:DUF4147 domain-containing protein [uncultured Aliiroseovarius sp.]|uniref:glycerate kinase type-2 family protein n=1 Tax=uncultured Aliiroseovarius sp. TaxID=1658783 RepID=UPI002620067E|nr:DUF4147 domain-containing protein [uncultured Aliiroseovarius sp.]